VADYPDSLVRKAAEIRMRQYESEYSLGSATWRDFVPEVTEILDAVTEDLGAAVAAKILAHADEYDPLTPADLTARWRRHFGICSRIAAGAFLSEDDMRRIAAREMAAGNYVACKSLEGDDDR